MSRKNGENVPAVKTAEPKKKHRKPVWVCIPLEFRTTRVLDESGEDTGDAQQEVVSYKIERCETKDEIREVLKTNEIDPTNFHHVIMLRADPMQFEISRQIVIRI